MNIGDRVRMLRGREEGVVTRFLDGQLVEVEIEDGFKIPILRSELAVVSTDEGRLLKRSTGETTQSSARPAGAIFATKGLYMAFVAVNDREMSLYLLNNSDWELPFTFGEESTAGYKGLKAGVMKGRTSLKIGEYLVAQFDNWPVFVWQTLFHREGTSPLQTTLPAPLLKRMRFRANTFFKNKAKAPLLDRDAHLFQVDLETPTTPAAAPAPIQPDKIVDQMQQSAAALKTVNPLTPPPSAVDLHIEQLTDNPVGISKHEILKLQLDTFEKQFENAIATGMREITFIHGIGNGTLRTELHKRLSRHPHVQYYEDAQKEKFGYGATKVRIK